MTYLQGLCSAYGADFVDEQLCGIWQFLIVILFTTEHLHNHASCVAEAPKLIDKASDCDVNLYLLV